MVTVAGTGLSAAAAFPDPLVMSWMKTGYLGLKPAPVWDVGTTCGRFTSHTTVLPQILHVLNRSNNLYFTPR